MASLIASMPLHLLCQLIGSGTPAVNNTNIAVNQPQPQIQPTTLPEGFVAHPDIGVAYKLFTFNVTWTEARERCILSGARLAVIDSKKKLDLIVKQLGPLDYYPHIGIYRMDTTWVDVNTGTTLSNIPWLSGYPASDSSAVCTRVDTTSSPGVIHDYCSNVRNYVCEVSLPENYQTQRNLVAEISAN